MQARSPARSLLLLRSPAGSRHRAGKQASRSVIPYLSIDHDDLVPRYNRQRNGDFVKDKRPLFICLELSCGRCLDVHLFLLGLGLLEDAVEQALKVKVFHVPSKEVLEAVALGTSTL